MSKIVEAYYNASVQAEWSRLDRHFLEFEITKKHIDQFLTPGSTLLDLGGGPGKYAFHYAAAGHRVTLFDLSSANIAFAAEKEAESGIRLERKIVGNATTLAPLADGTFDFVLCMGPLYHLTAPGDRMQVVRECWRVLRTGGRAVFSFVTPMAQTLSLIKRNPAGLEAWEPTLNQGIETGINDQEFDTGFTEAYFTRPEAIRDLVGGEGFRVLKVAGAEGIACQSEEVLRPLSLAQRTRWIDFLFRHSEDPATLGANQHVVCAAEKD